MQLELAADEVMGDVENNQLWKADSERRKLLDLIMGEVEILKIGHFGALKLLDFVVAEIEGFEVGKVL